MAKEETNRNIEKSSSEAGDNKGIFISISSCLAAFFILFIYSRDVPANGSIFLGPDLYNFASVVLFAFFASVILFFIGIKKGFFSKNKEANPLKLIRYIQLPFSNKKYVLIFVISSIAYFIFFGFLSNLFIIFNPDNTVFTLIPSIFGPAVNNSHVHNHNSMKGSMDSVSPSHHQQQQMEDQQPSNFQNNDQNTMVMPSSNSTNNADNFESEKSISYPYYRLIVCCNSVGYVPMMTLSISQFFSILIIPLNVLLGAIISTLVGINVSLNIFLLRTYKLKPVLTKRGLLSGLGMSSGLLIGCPTCAGSVIYSIAGFSSLVTFSSLISYQLIFISISIPILIASVFVLTKLLQKREMNACAL